MMRMLMGKGSAILVVAVKAVAGTRQRWVEEVTTPGAADTAAALKPYYSLNHYAVTLKLCPN